MSQMVTDALSIELPAGEHEGACGLCGVSGRGLLAANYRSTFTSAEFLHDTGLMCPSCYTMYNDGKFRYSNWACHPSGFEKLKHPDVLPWLLDFDGPYPFVLYTTSTYKKQGWIRLQRALNYSSGFVVVGWDMNLVTLQVRSVRRHADTLHQLIELGVKKGFLLSGDVPLGVLRKLPPLLKKPVLEYLTKNKDDLSWQWVVHFFPLKGYKALEEDVEVLLNEQQS